MHSISKTDEIQLLSFGKGNFSSSGYIGIAHVSMVHQEFTYLLWNGVAYIILEFSGEYDDKNNPIDSPIAYIIFVNCPLLYCLGFSPPTAISG